MPKFSIILPVKDGGTYVKECVNSILSQGYRDFTFHVLDNCSKDGTGKWIRSLNDERIIIYPSEKALSIEENWRRILSIQKNEFITLIGHDDILDPQYLEVMNELIRQHSSAGLYQTGGGIKTKLVESIAYGTTVVSTRSGATGIDKTVCGDKLIIVNDNDWRTFSEAIMANLSKITATPPAYYQEYSWKALADRIARELS